MNFDGNFRRVGQANVAPTRAWVDKLSDNSWQADGATGAERIDLVHDDGLRHDQPTRQPALEVFGKVIRPILAVVADHFDASPAGRVLTQQYGTGYFVRARLMRVRASGSYAAAPDTAPSQQKSYRVHVPILTAPGVRFTVGDEALSLPDGEIYEINNLRNRRLENGAETDCVHLVLDYVLDRSPTG